MRTYLILLFCLLLPLSMPAPVFYQAYTTQNVAAVDARVIGLISGPTNGASLATITNVINGMVPTILVSNSVNAAILTPNTNTFTSVTFSNNFVRVILSPDPKFLGEYIMVYSNTVSGNQYEVYRQLSSGTNFVTKNDPNGVLAGFVPPFWQIGVSNDVSAINPYSTDSGNNLGPGDIIDNPKWSDWGETTNAPIIVSYAPASVPAYGLNIRFQTNATGPVYVANSGDDGADGRSLLTPLKTIYSALGKATTNYPIMLAPGSYKSEFLSIPNFIISGSGAESTVFTNAVGMLHGGQWDNVSFVQYNGTIPATEQQTFNLCVFGNDLGIDALFPSGSSGMNKFYKCRFISNWDTANNIDSGTYIFDGCSFIAKTVHTNVAGVVSRVNGIHISGTATAYLINSSISISNPAPGLLSASVVNTNTCILMNGPNCNLYISPSTTLDTNGAAMSAAIGFINSASSAQVHVLPTWPYGLNGGTLFGSVLNTTNGNVNVGGTSGDHLLNINSASNNVVAINSTGTDSTSMLHIMNVGVQGPFFDFHSSNQRWAWGNASGGNFVLRNSAVGTDPVNGTTLFSIQPTTGILDGNGAGITNVITTNTIVPFSVIASATNNISLNNARWYAGTPGQLNNLACAAPYTYTVLVITNSGVVTNQFVIATPCRKQNPATTNVLNVEPGKFYYAMFSWDMGATNLWTSQQQ